MSQRTTKPVNTNFDDWETDPDFVREMDEMDQRWGSKRTVGSINMNELIDEVRRDHKLMREKFHHPSERDHSQGFGGKFGIQHDRKDQSAQDYDYHEQLSKHSSQEISRQVISSSKSSFIKEESISSGQPNGRAPSSMEAKRAFLEKTTRDSRDDEIPQGLKSVRDKFNAFKKEMEDIESKVAKKSDISRVIKKASNFERSSNVEYVSRGGGAESTPAKSSHDSPYKAFSTSSSTTGGRPVSRSPLGDQSYSRGESPRATGAGVTAPARTSIKSLSEKFETLGRDDSEKFRQRTENERKEFFDRIKNQVRETRKGLDGFDAIDDDLLDNDDRHSKPQKAQSFTTRLTTTSMPSKPSSRPSSRLSGDSLGSSGKPKIYTRRETTQEEVVSRLVKENDKVIENETKRNVERSSSCHGSSDEESTHRQSTRANVIDVDEPSLISKYNEQELQRQSVSPQRTTQSPIEELKRRNPPIEPKISGAGLMARTMFDYQAQDDDELSFDVDDLITNIEKIDPGWYKGTITKGTLKKVGLFPANHVKLLNDHGEY